VQRIVVGVDGSEGCRRAVDWAYDEAVRQDASLEVVTAWEMPVIPPALAPATLSQFDEIEPATRKMVDELLEDVIGSRTGVDVRATVVEGAPARVLLDVAKGADLLVVGSRGLGGFGSLLLGSVSQRCAQHATCPIVIVPPPDRD
jgi:nucleotide-binding universal stress UspA family protein